MPRHLKTFAALFVAALLCVCATAAAGARQDAHGKSPVVALSDLPAEARETLRLIRRGGPFPYARDGAVFGNREGLLPRAARGSYREYTVPTPGRHDRGARRIVGSAGGEFYYTADHYRSFHRIVP